MIEEASAPDDQSTVLTTGASGHIGGRLLAVLEQSGCRIRCLSRQPEYLQSRLGSMSVAWRGDLLDAESLRPALAGVWVAYDLVHSMAAGTRFRDLDLDAARTFGSVA